MSNNTRVNILSDVGLNGSLIMLQNNESFPANPALGTMVIKNYGLYAYIQVGELQTWYPFNNNKTKSYVHNQITPSSQWNVVHNLDSSEVWFQVYSTSGVPVFASRSSITANSFKLDLVEAIAGTVVVVSPDTLEVPYVKSQSFTVGEGTANVTVIDNNGVRVNGQQVLTSGTVQPLSADLTAIDALAGNSGLLKKTAADTWTLDTSSYLTANQSITFSGDATGSGSTTVSLTLSESGVTAGTYKSVTVDAKGRVTAGTNPTTLDGYGITDAVSSSNPTLTGTIQHSGSIRSTINTISASTVDCSLGNYFTKTVSSDTTFVFSNAPNSVAYSFTMRVYHTGGVITFPGSVQWPGNQAPSLSSGKYHMFMFVTENGGTTWRGAALINYNS